MSSVSAASPGPIYSLDGHIKGQYHPAALNQDLSLKPVVAGDSFVPTQSQSSPPHVADPKADPNHSPSAEISSVQTETVPPPPPYEHPPAYTPYQHPEHLPAYATALADSPPPYPHPVTAQKPQIVYVDINAPDHKWMQQILEKTTLKPEDFLSHGKLKTHLTAAASAFRKGAVGTLAGAGVTGLGSIGVMAATLAGAGAFPSPATPILWSMAAALGSVPVIGGLLAGLVWSNKDKTRNKAALAEMKTNLVNNPDKYDAFFRKTQTTSAGKSAQKHNLRTASQLENYLRADSKKPMLWKVHLPVLPKSKVNMVITTANPYNAKQLLERMGYGKAAQVVSDVAKDTAKKVAQQAVKA
jgi:hypothetical protein